MRSQFPTMFTYKLRRETHVRANAISTCYTHTHTHTQLHMSYVYLLFFVFLAYNIYVRGGNTLYIIPSLSMRSVFQKMYPYLFSFSIFYVFIKLAAKRIGKLTVFIFLLFSGLPALYFWSLRIWNDMEGILTYNT